MKITLNIANKEFPQVPEGERILEVIEASVIPSGAPQQLQIRLKDIETGATTLKSWKFSSSGQLYYMGKFLEIALGLKDGDEFDTKDVNKLVGMRFNTTVSHSEYNGRMYANIDTFNSKVDTEFEMPDTSILETPTVDTTFDEDSLPF